MAHQSIIVEESRGEYNGSEYRNNAPLAVLRNATSSKYSSRVPLIRLLNFVLKILQVIRQKF